MFHKTFYPRSQSAESYLKRAAQTATWPVDPSCGRCCLRGLPASGALATWSRQVTRACRQMPLLHPTRLLRGGRPRQVDVVGRPPPPAVCRARWRATQRAGTRLREQGRVAWALAWTPPRAAARTLKGTAWCCPRCGKATATGASGPWSPHSLSPGGHSAGLCGWRVRGQGWFRAGQRERRREPMGRSRPQVSPGAGIPPDLPLGHGA